GSGVRRMGDGGARLPQRSRRRARADAGARRAAIGTGAVSSALIPSADITPRGVAPAEVWDGPEVVLVHDWIGGVHGAEQVLRELATLFPKAPILTLFTDTRVLPALGIDPARVRQSYLGRVPNAIRLRKV